MANRFPLVINNSSTLVSEMQAGDTLNLSGSGIFDGVSTGTVGYVLTSLGTSGVEWRRAADVFVNDTQTLRNKTLEDCTIDATENTISNIPNSSLVNNSITVNLTRDGIVYAETVPLGGTYEFEDENDNTLYSISVVAGNNTTSEKIRLTASGSGNSTQDVVLSVDGTYLSISRESADEIKITASMQSLTAGSYLVGDSYNGLTARTWSVNATPGTASAVGTGQVVARDVDGNFYANTITATLSGTATQTSKSITFGSYISAVETGTTTAISSFNGSKAVTVNAIASTTADADKLVLRDSSGNMAARDLSLRNLNVTLDLTAASVKISGGTSSQFLKANGTVDSTSYFENVISSNGYGTRYIRTLPPTAGLGQDGDIAYVIA